VEKYHNEVLLMMSGCEETAKGDRLQSAAFSHRARNVRADDAIAL